MDALQRRSVGGDAPSPPAGCEYRLTEAATGFSVDPFSPLERQAMNRVYIKTYGCQMNERDSEAVAAMLRNRGYRIVSSEEQCDILLLNTCSVRDAAGRGAGGGAARGRRRGGRGPGGGRG